MVGSRTHIKVDKFWSCNINDILLLFALCRTSFQNVNLGMCRYVCEMVGTGALPGILGRMMDGSE